MIKGAEHVWIGTSGWSYKHWLGAFYPAGLPAREHLSFYSERFHTVELNTPFYHLPAETTPAKWREGTPEGFIFAVKASRYITHIKRLADAEDSVHKFLERMAPLGEKFGPVLFQLPPRWHYNEERLRAFVDLLPEGHRYAFEFRDPTWLNPRAYEILRSRNAALCVYDFNFYECPCEVTADFVYVRLHGPAGKYAGLYGPEGLEPWARRIKRWAGPEGLAVYCYFDNDQNAYATRDAQMLNDMIRGPRRFKARPGKTEHAPQSQTRRNP